MPIEKKDLSVKGVVKEIGRVQLEVIARDQNEPAKTRVVVMEPKIKSLISKALAKAWCESMKGIVVKDIPAKLSGSTEHSIAECDNIYIEILAREHVNPVNTRLIQIPESVSTAITAAVGKAWKECHKDVA